MPDPAIAEFEEHRQDGPSLSPASRTSRHCPPTMTYLDWNRLRSQHIEDSARALESHEDGSCPPDSPDHQSMTGSEFEDGEVSTHPSEARQPSADSHLSRRTPRFVVPYHDIDVPTTQRDRSDGFEAEDVFSGAAYDLAEMRRHVFESQLRVSQQSRHGSVVATEDSSLPSIQTSVSGGYTGVSHARPIQATGHRSATPGPDHGASRTRARLGLLVPSNSASVDHSQLRTPLNIRGPQTPNPATAIVANDPVQEENSTPTSPDQSRSTPPPESRPFGRYTPSFLYHGSVFKGTQRSDRQVYNVEVKIQHVDMDESFMCGFLKIEGLTEDNPTLETYFEGEIIGSKYTFTTRHNDWGATEKQDMLHWNRFGAWKPLARSARSPDFSYRNFAEREHIFMRWKEHFLVPDHNVKAISGASFEGFYYICFNQRYGAFSGIYYHSKSEKWQQLELKHEGNMGTMPAVEFR